MLLVWLNCPCGVIDGTGATALSSLMSMVLKALSKAPRRLSKPKPSILRGLTARAPQVFGHALGGVHKKVNTATLRGMMTLLKKLVVVFVIVIVVVINNNWL